MKLLAALGAVAFIIVGVAGLIVITGLAAHVVWILLSNGWGWI
jgi:hypothetical protein